MKYILSIVLMLASCSAFSSEETKRQQLNELMDLMSMSSLVDSMYSQFEAQMKGMSAQMGVKPSEQVIFDKYYTKMIQLMKNEISWKKMEPAVMDIYNRNFTEKEVADMLAFYRTETGKSVIKKLPVVMQESMQMSNGMVQKIIPEIQKLSQELAAELESSRKSNESKPQ